MTADGTPTPRTGEVTITLPEHLDGLADGREVTDQRGVVWTATSVASPTGRMWSSGGSALSSRGLLNGGPVILRPDAPQPTTGDDVERAARAVAEEMTHDTDYDPAYDYTEDSHRYARAALAAARAGEAEHDPRCISLTDSEFNNHCDCRTLRTLDAAQRGGETVDRREVQRRIDLTLKSVARFADRTAKTPGERQSIIATLADAQADVALLAARGDAAPTVTAEQVERARLSEPMTYPPGQQVSRAAARHLLAALGIEVRS